MREREREGVSERRTLAQSRTRLPHLPNGQVMSRTKGLLMSPTGSQIDSATTFRKRFPRISQSRTRLPHLSCPTGNHIETDVSACELNLVSFAKGGFLCGLLKTAFENAVSPPFQHWISDRCVHQTPNPNPQTLNPQPQPPNSNPQTASTSRPEPPNQKLRVYLLVDAGW